MGHQMTYIPSQWTTYRHKTIFPRTLPQWNSLKFFEKSQQFLLLPLLKLGTDVLAKAKALNHAGRSGLNPCDQFGSWTMDVSGQIRQVIDTLFTCPLLKLMGGLFTLFL